MRGEKPTSSAVTPHPIGSPPHARGKAMANEFLSIKNRITPACAGKSLRSDIVPANIWDHPRMRGEKTKKDPINQAFGNHIVSDFI